MVAVHDGIDRRHAEKTVAGARNAIELKSVAKEYKAAGGGAFRAVAGSISKSPRANSWRW